jgi:O-antigen ligase/polysaccharide polymerase Wzy-like membrane protein
VAAAGLVGVLVFARVAISHSSYLVRAVSAACVVLAVGTALYLVFRTTGATPSEAVSIRWAFLQTTASMLFAEPAFGVGIGQYSLWSAHYAPPELFKIWRPDNAHNNLAQIAGELGLVGLITFVIVLVVSFRTRSNVPAANVMRGPLIAGLSVFILTWLGGHPLLVGESAYPFWITLGVVATVIASDFKANPWVAIIGIAAVLLLVSIPFRVDSKSAQLDLARVSYGVSARQLMTSRARFFVPAGESRVEFPLRARSASDNEPVEIDVLVDGSASDTITLTDRNWRRTPVNLSGDSSRRFHQIDLRIRPDTLDNLDPGRSSVEVGKWEIIPKPNG